VPVLRNHSGNRTTAHGKLLALAAGGGIGNAAPGTNSRSRLLPDPLSRPLPGTRSRTGPTLPESIAFLAALGLLPGDLARATSVARSSGVRPEHALMAEGLISEREYYAALARHLGLQFIGARDEAADIVPGQGTAFPQSIRAGFAPLQAGNSEWGQVSGPAWLMAPQGVRIDELFTLRRRGTLPVSRFAITTPSVLRSLVVAHDGEQTADAAANTLFRNRPDLSARSAAPWGLTVFLCLAFLLLVAGFLSGGIFWLLLSLSAGSVLSGSIVLRLFAAAGSFDPLSREELLAQRTGAPRIEDRDLPLYTVVVALYREAASAAQLASALSRIDYPASRLQIVVAMEEDDAATRQAFEALALPARFELLTLPDGAPRTKPRALNAALALARGEYICVFDAEDIPGKLQLREAAAVFETSGRELACRQARLTIDNRNESWFSRHFAIEYAALFDVINPGLAWLGMPLPLGGTSNHFRGIRQQRHQA